MFQQVRIGREKQESWEAINELISCFNKYSNTQEIFIMYDILNRKCILVSFLPLAAPYHILPLPIPLSFFSFSPPFPSLALFFLVISFPQRGPLSCLNSEVPSCFHTLKRPRLPLLHPSPFWKIYSSKAEKTFSKGKVILIESHLITWLTFPNKLIVIKKDEQNLVPFGTI